MKRWLFILLTVLVLTACNNNPKGLYDQQEDRAGRSFVANKDTGQDNTQSRGWQRSDQNPNFLNTDGGRVDYDGYIDKARETVNATNEFEAGSIWVNGNRLWVTAYKKGQMSRQERVDAEARLHKMLVKAVPRYEIEVQVKEDRS